MFIWLFLIIVACLIIVLKQKKIISINAIMEGIMIGVISGLIISFVTEGNFRANILSPVIKLAKLFNMKVRYISKDWINIRVKEVGRGVYDVDATNIATGSVVKFEKSPISVLPPDLRYDIATSDVVRTKVSINIPLNEQDKKN